MVSMTHPNYARDRGREDIHSLHGQRAREGKCCFQPSKHEAAAGENIRARAPFGRSSSHPELLLYARLRQSNAYDEASDATTYARRWSEGDSRGGK